MINDGDGNDGDHNDYQDYGHSDNVDYDHYHEEGASVGTQSHLASREARLWHCCHDSHSQEDHHQYIQLMVSCAQCTRCNATVLVSFSLTLGAAAEPLTLPMCQLKDD